MNPKFTYQGQFIAKPRMTRSDRWKKRACVVKYWGFKDAIKEQATIAGFELQDIVSIEFRIPIPKSRAKKLKQGEPHKQKPDLDNLIKSVQDALKDKDESIYQYSTIKKVWWSEPQIVFY